MTTFYDNVRCENSSLVIIKDNGGYIFGIFVASEWETPGESHFFGTIDTFIFRIFPQPKKWTWTKKNRFFVLSQNDGFTIGGGYVI